MKLPRAIILGGVIQGVVIGSISAWLCGASFFGGLIAATVCTVLFQIGAIILFTWLLKMVRRKRGE